jgi:hypothetical protein
MQSEAGTLLVEGGLISEAQLQRALTASVNSGGGLVQNLIRLGATTGDRVAAFFASRLQLPLAQPSQFDNLPAFITRLVPIDVVMNHRTVPLMLHQGVLHMAISDPTNRAALEEISFITGYSASAVAAADELIESAMARYYDIPPDDAMPAIGSAPGRPGERLGPSPRAAPSHPAARDAFAAGPPPNEQSGPTSQPPAPAAEADGTDAGESPVAAGAAEDSAGAVNAVVVEPASGELAELFGLEREREIIHLTRPKRVPPKAESITDAIRQQVAPEAAAPPDPPERSSEARPAPDAGDPPAPPEPPPAPPEPPPAPPEPPAAPPEPPPAPPEPPPAPPEPPPAPPEPPATTSEPPAALSRQPELDQQASPFQPQAAARSTAGPAVEPEAAGATVDDGLAPLRDAELARNAIAEAGDRDAVARTLLRYARTSLARVVLFIVRKDLLVGWMGAGQGIDPKQVKGIMIPLSSPSVFRTVRETGTDYFGNLSRTTVNDIFLSALGDLRPRQVLLIPISVRHKPICILYGDCGTEAGFTQDLSGVHLMAEDASAAFEQLILQRKMGRLVKR